MIFFHPVHGPSVGDLAALELRRDGDADIADLLAVIRKLVSGPNPDAEARLLNLQEDLEEATAELEEAREELEKLRRKSSAKEFEKLQTENFALTAKLNSIKSVVSA